MLDQDDVTIKGRLSCGTFGLQYFWSLYMLDQKKLACLKWSCDTFDFNSYVNYNLDNIFVNFDTSLI